MRGMNSEEEDPEGSFWEGDVTTGDEETVLSVLGEVQELVQCLEDLDNEDEDVTVEE